MTLKLLSDGKVELPFVCTGLSWNFIKAITPVDTQQAEHGQKGSQTDPCRSFDKEGVEVADGIPCITTFKEHQSEYGCRGIQGEGITQFHSIFIIYITRFVPVNNRRQTSVFIPTQCDGFPSVKVVSCKAVATEIKAFEGRGSDIFVVISEVTKMCTGIQYQIPCQTHIPVGFEFPFMVFNPFILLLITDSRLAEIFAVDQRIGWCELETKAE